MPLKGTSIYDNGNRSKYEINMPINCMNNKNRLINVYSPNIPPEGQLQYQYE